jgi:hypothetical protein
MEIRLRIHARLLVFMAAVAALAAGFAHAESQAVTYEGKARHIGRGTAHAFVRTDASGTPVSIGVAFSPGMLEGLPEPAKGGSPDFPYLLSMPAKGPRTIVDHVVVDWESAGHPPPHVYDVPHFDFHFYLVSRAERMKVAFKSESASGDPGQQPPPERLPAGYVVPPGTAMSRMGVHAIDPSAPEFHGKPFAATFIYGYYNKRLTFVEPMASLAYLKSKPSFSTPVARPASYPASGAYPSAYSVRYDAARDLYEVVLEDLK